MVTRRFSIAFFATVVAADVVTKQLNLADMRPVRVLHPSGSGGRTLGEMATHAKVSKPRDSATMPCQSFCDWTYSSYSRDKDHILDRTGRYSCNKAVHTCEAMDMWYKKTGYKYASTEMLLPEAAPGGKLCPQFHYVVALRHPLERLASEIRKHDDDVMNFYDQMVGPVGFFLAKRGSAMRTTAAVSNYYIRALLGDSVYFLPAGNLTSVHLEQAKAILLQFSAVIPLQLLDTTFGHDMLRKIPVMQNITEARQSHIHTGIQNGTRPSWETTAIKMNITTDVLKRNNRLDLMLYEWVLRNFMKDAGQLDKAATAKEPQTPSII